MYRNHAAMYSRSSQGIAKSSRTGEGEMNDLLKDLLASSSEESDGLFRACCFRREKKNTFNLPITLTYRIPATSGMILHA
jgi:hypothetical protein